jgi:hypothetical protein
MPVSHEVLGAALRCHGMSTDRMKLLVNALRLAWRGKLSLAMVWWLIFVPYVVTSRLLITYLSGAVEGLISYIMYTIVWGALLVGAVIVYTMAWRCAENSSQKFWRNAAQGFLLLSGIATMLQLIVSIGKAL